MNKRIALCVALAALHASGCRPRVFADAGAFEVLGTAPEPAPEPVALPEQIELREKVQFARGSWRILAASHAMLDDVAARINGAVDITKIRIEGHASADGNDADNLRLSAARARAVRDYLVAAGVAGDKLTSEGFGEERPVADNETPEGREQNRRVELHIIGRATTSEGAQASR